MFEPFAATNTGTQWIRAHLEEEIFVEKIILGPSTTIGGWGATYLNNGTLQYSTNNGSSWNNIRTLSGYVNATNATIGTMQEEAIGAVCTDIRVLRSGYLAISEFKILA